MPARPFRLTRRRRRRIVARMSTRSWQDLLAGAARAAGALLASPRRREPERTKRGPATPRTSGSRKGPGPATPRGSYPGDFTGPLTPLYAPALDGDADPGEIVWTWVPYEEDFARGKDRPVLVVGHDGPWLLALMLTSKDHARDSSVEARNGRRWVDIGSGPWDVRGRASEVRVDRVLRIAPDRVRREGAIMDRSTFNQVTAQIV